MRSLFIFQSTHWSLKSFKFIFLFFQSSELFEEYFKKINFRLSLQGFSLKLFQVFEYQFNFGLRLQSHILFLILKDEVKEFH